MAVPWRDCNLTRCTQDPALKKEEGSQRLIPPHVFDTIIFISSGTLQVVLGLVGVLTNTVNMVVFRKMGFTDTVNISLFALALSDTFSSITIGWGGVSVNQYFWPVGLSFDPAELGNLTGGWTHVICVRVSGWITALVSFERFMCIARPLEVKTIFTPLRVKILIAVIYIFNIVPSMAIVTYTHRMVWNSVDNGTSSFLSVAYSPDREEIEAISNIFTQNISPFLTFVMVVAPTVGLVVKLSEKKKWRDSATSAESSKTSESNTKDSRAAKMVTLVSVIYIICFTPNIIGFVVWVILPTDFHWTGRLFDVFLTFFSLTFVLDGINSNINFLIYYKMSSRFKKTFRKMIGAKV